MSEIGGVRIPTPEPISLRQNPFDNIRFFKHQWKYFCIATGLDRSSSEKKVATFFLYIGREACTYIYENLELSADEMNDCDRILAALEDRHKPSSNVIRERFAFHRTVQEAAESIDEFVAKLRGLAERCGFQERLDEMVRDRLVVGVKDEAVQRELLAESELSLAKAVRIAKRVEEERLQRASQQPSSIDGVTLMPIDTARQILDMLGAHSTTFVADPKPAQCPVKQEKIDDDDLMIVNPSPADCVSSSNRALKRIKLEPEGGVDRVEPPTIDVELEHSAEAENEMVNMKPGSFVVLKEDWNKMTDPPIWRVDTASLVQKFIPIEHNGITLYKSTAVYR